MTNKSKISETASNKSTTPETAMNNKSTMPETATNNKSTMPETATNNKSTTLETATNNKSTTLETATNKSTTPETATNKSTTPETAMAFPQWSKLTDELKLCCLSRVPKKFYPCIQRASANLNTIVSSGDIRLCRKNWGTMEEAVILYIDNRWYELCETLSGRKTLQPFALNPISPSSWLSTFMGIGSDVVSFGASSLVIRDCSSNAENCMRVDEHFSLPAMALLGGTLYCVGLCSKSRQYRGIVVNPKTHSLEILATAQFTSTRGTIRHKGLVLNTKIYVKRVGMCSLLFDPSKMMLVEAEPLVDLHWTLESCVLGEEILSISSLDRNLYAYDGDTWKLVRNSKLENPFVDLKLLNHKGNLLVLYKKGEEIWGKEMKIKQEGKDRVGEVVWCEMLLKVESRFFHLHEALTVTI